MSEFKETGDIVVDVSRLLARAGMRLNKVKPPTERQREHLDEALEYMKMAGELLTQWDDQRIDADADEQALAAIVERHVKRIMQEAVGQP